MPEIPTFVKKVIFPATFYREAAGQIQTFSGRPGAFKIAMHRSGLAASMKTYLIERDIPGAGNLTAADLKGISQKSCGVLKEMNGIQWMHSYVTGNKIFCVYKAQNEELLREHATKGGFPITNITEIGTTIGPKTAKE